MEDEKNSPLAKFTHSIRSDGTEMLVIRTDSEEELIEIRNRLFPRIAYGNPPDEPPAEQPKEEPKKQEKPTLSLKKPYLNEGDSCQVCDGTMSVKKATNRNTGNEFNFLGCSNYPECDFTAYISKQKKRA